MTELPPGVSHWDGPPLEAWAAWTPWEALEVLRGVDVPWCVVGGWAIDLFLGGVTRPHGDLEIAIARTDFPRVRRALAAFALYVVGDGEVRTLPPAEDPPAHHHQIWVVDVEAGAWRIDVMLEPGDQETWVCRRDEAIREPRATMVDETEQGIPFLRPHGVLLYKAKAARPKDERDLDACLTLLEPECRRWLLDALELVHPGHPWIARLQA